MLRKTAPQWRSRPLRSTTAPRTERVPDAELSALMERAVMRWLDTEDAYDAIIAAYMDKHGVDAIDDPVAHAAQAAIAEQDAGTDPRLKRAISNGQWHRSRALTAASVLMARDTVRRTQPSTKE